MATTSIDTSELEYLKSCKDKLRDIGEILGKDEGDDEEKLKEIRRTIGGELSSHKNKRRQGGKYFHERSSYAS